MTRKKITFCVPSYNSEDYLERALDSLIPVGDEIEVLVIDDGSHDRTLQIAKYYESKYPNIFRAIHEENKGHGGAINNALSQAKGTYFKVLDSDDWVDEKGLQILLDRLAETTEPDMILMDYTYRHINDEKEKKKNISYSRFMTPDKILTWKNIRTFDVQTNLTLHSVIFKTELLREAHVVLPEHCFYEDNLFIYVPLPYVKKILYIHHPFYQYLLGRSGQSMQTSNLVKRNHDLMKVALLSFDSHDIVPLKRYNKGLYHMMKHQLSLLVEIPLMYTSYKEKEIAKKEKKEFISQMMKNNPRQYHLLHKSLYIKLAAGTNTIGNLSSRFMLSAVRLFGAIN